MRVDKLLECADGARKIEQRVWAVGVRRYGEIELEIDRRKGRECVGCCD